MDGVIAGSASGTGVEVDGWLGFALNESRRMERGTSEGSTFAPRLARLCQPWCFPLASDAAILILIKEKRHDRNTMPNGRVARCRVRA
jgi:hypothetical protein